MWFEGVHSQLCPEASSYWDSALGPISGLLMSYPPLGSRSPQDHRDILLTAGTPSMILLIASLLATRCGHP